MAVGGAPTIELVDLDNDHAKRNLVLEETRQMLAEMEFREAMIADASEFIEATALREARQPRPAPTRDGFEAAGYGNHGTVLIPDGYVPDVNRNALAGFMQEVEMRFFCPAFVKRHADRAGVLAGLAALVVAVRQDVAATPVTDYIMSRMTGDPFRPPVPQMNLALAVDDVDSGFEFIENGSKEIRRPCLRHKGSSRNNSPKGSIGGQRP